MPEENKLDLKINTEDLNTHEKYMELWKQIGKIEVKCVEKNEECKHNVGDLFYYENPYRRPEGVCQALLHVLDFYTWRAAVGFPSWNGQNRKIFKLHCPDPKGTVWEMRKID